VRPDTAKQIFDRGFSTKSAAVVGGRGIGLSLVRRICEQRGGAVGVQYADGAVFTAVLPVRAPAPEPLALGETHDEAGIPPVSANGVMR
jgi:signal transduction histidine kinase